MKSRPTVWQSTNTAYKHKGIVNGNQNNNCSLNCHCKSDCNCNNVHSAQMQSQIEYGLRNRFIPCEGEWGSEWSKVCAGICFAYVPLAVDCVVGQTMRQTMVAADATADDFGWAGGSNDRQYMANSCASMAMPRSQSPFRPHPPSSPLLRLCAQAHWERNGGFWPESSWIHFLALSGVSIGENVQFMTFEGKAEGDAAKRS